MNRKTNVTKPEAAQPAPEAKQEDRAPNPAQEASTQPDIEQIVERVVARQLSRFQQQADARAAQARAEGERLAGMSEDERRRYEADVAKEREDALNRREAELDRRELRAWVADELLARSLPRELVEVVDMSDAQRCAAAVDALERAFRQAVQRGVDERIGRGRPLPRSIDGAPASITQRMRAAAGLCGN